jgi:predicted outer membrane protein
MLAQILSTALIRSLSDGTAGKRGRALAGRSMARLSVMQGEVVQLDAIGYSDEELIAREINTHREAIALYEDQASGPDAQMRVLARQILPQLQQHLAMLETLKSERPHARR